MASEEDGLQLDPWTRVINVHWDSGLAVIFGERNEDAPKQEKE
jgi:hypothetical protein